MTQRVSSEQAVSLGLEHLSALLNSAQELLALVHPDGSLLFVNEPFCGLLGYPADQLAGASLFRFLHPNEEPLLRTHLQASAQTSNAERNSRCRLQSKDGAWRWFEISIRNRQHEHPVDAVVLSLVDVNDLQRMESERQ